ATRESDRVEASPGRRYLCLALGTCEASDGFQGLFIQRGIAMYVATGERSASRNPTARALYDHLKRWEEELGLTDASVFFDFPLYRDDERLVQCQFLVVSASCGVVLAGVSNVQRDAANALRKAEATLDAAFGQLMARLIKNPRLRRGRVELEIPFDGFV